MTTNQQLELGINGIQSRTPDGPHGDRGERAAWWFAQIRRRVADAMDWQAAGQPPRKPDWLPTAQPK